MADLFNFVQGQDYFLAGSGASSTDTSITLKSFTFPNSGDLITMADFGDTGFGVLEPGTQREENISWTGVTQNPSGTATLTGVTRGLDFAAPYTAVSGLAKSHAGNRLFRVSNTAPFYNELTGKDNDETVTGTWTFTDPKLPRMDTYSPPTDAEQFATKQYVDDTAAGGTVSVDGLIVSATAGETVAAGQVVYFDETDSEWKLASAANASTANNVVIGVAQGAGTDGNLIAGGVLLRGRERNQSGLTAGDRLYLSDTPGALANAPGTISVEVGHAVDATSIDLTPRFASINTAQQKNNAAAVSGAGEGSTFYTDAQGDVQEVTVGTADQVYTVNAGATAPEWQTKEFLPDPAADQDIVTYQSGAYSVKNLSEYIGDQETSYWHAGMTGSVQGGVNNFSSTSGINVSSATATYQAGISQSYNIIEGCNPENGCTVSMQVSISLTTEAATRHCAFGLSNAGTTMYAAGGGVLGGSSRFAGFIYENSVLRAFSRNTGAEELTTISGVTASDYNLYKFEFDGSSEIRFYVNGTLVATHTSELITASFDVLGFGAADGTTAGTTGITVNVGKVFASFAGLT